MLNTQNYLRFGDFCGFCVDRRFGFRDVDVITITERPAFSPGSFSWGGANGTLFWIDPQEDLIGILMIQINPYAHFNIRPLFSVAVSQAITDSLADQKPRIMRFDTSR